MKITKKYYTKSNEYLLFLTSPFDDYLDRSEAARQEMFVYESTGKGSVPVNNAFAVGKKALNMTVSMWREDIKKGWLLLKELHEDSKFTKEFLDSVLLDVKFEQNYLPRWETT